MLHSVYSTGTRAYHHNVSFNHLSGHSFPWSSKLRHFELDQIMKKQDRMIERRKKDNSFTDTYNGR